MRDLVALSAIYCKTVRETNDESYFKFKRDQRIIRTNTRHRSDVTKLKQCTSKTEE